jgi:hypothetical protein
MHLCVLYDYHKHKDYFPKQQKQITGWPQQSRQNVLFVGLELHFYVHFRQKNRICVVSVNGPTDITVNTVDQATAVHVRNATFPIAPALLRHILRLLHVTSLRAASHLLVLKFRRPSKAVAHPVVSDASSQRHVLPVSA